MLGNLISRTTLKDLAGTTAFLRGEEYFAVGAVGRLRIAGDKVAAKVEGTDTYQVELRDDDGDLAYDCTCPRAEDGYFCKHCVALGLAWLAEQAEEQEPAEKSGKHAAKNKRRDPWRDIKDYLAAQPPETLIELLLGVAERDDRLYQSLLLKAETTVGGGNAAEAFRRAIDDATRIRQDVDWREAASFARDVDQVVDSLAELLVPEAAAMLVELAEHAIERIEGALEQVDDSDGEFAAIAERLGELHLNACAMARPDPCALAERLFHLETSLSFGLCSFDPRTYRTVLGEKGLQRYRELAEAEWSEILPRTDEKGYDSHRARITRIMERLAEAGGDVDELAAVKARDLSSGYRYLGIAEILANANRADEALEWAERGLEAFPTHPDRRLLDFLVSIYLERKRGDEAMRLTWLQFDEQPGLEAFQKLHDVATRLGIWPAQRERALAKVADAIEREANATSRWKPKPSVPNHSLRVSIALWEKDLDAAWAAAHQGVCDNHLLVALAGELESARPEDAISLYRQVVPPMVNQTNNRAYEDAIRLIRKVDALMKGLKQASRFGDYVAELRAQFKPKRNFIKLLDTLARPGKGA